MASKQKRLIKLAVIGQIICENSVWYIPVRVQLDQFLVYAFKDLNDTKI